MRYDDIKFRLVVNRPNKWALSKRAYIERMSIYSQCKACITIAQVGQLGVEGYQETQPNYVGLAYRWQR